LYLEDSGRFVIVASLGGAPRHMSQLALGSLPDKMRVEVEPDIEVSAKTVGELRKLTTWPETLAVTKRLAPCCCESMRSFARH